MKFLALFLLAYSAFVLQVGWIHAGEFSFLPVQTSFAPVLILLACRWLPRTGVIFTAVGIGVLSGLTTEMNIGWSLIAAGLVTFTYSLFSESVLKRGKISWLIVLSVGTVFWQIPFWIQATMQNGRFETLHWELAFNSVLLPAGVTVVISGMLFVVGLGLRSFFVVSDRSRLSSRLDYR